MFADRAATPLQGRTLPSPQQARFHSAARPAFRAHQPPDPHKVIERERVSDAIAAREPLRDSRGQRRIPLSNDSINKTLVTLTQILDSAVERGLLESNPARGKRRRLKVVKPVRRQLEADDLKELLAVAGDMDRNLYRGHRIGRRPMIAAMAKSGLRVTEMCRLRWRDVDVHHERLVIDEAKTDAGNRHVDLSLDVIEELMAWRAERQPASPDEYVFATASGDHVTRRTSPAAFSDRP